MTGSASRSEPEAEGRPLLTLLLPGLDGSGRLFARFIAAATGRLDLRVVSYPPGEPLGYPELAQRVLAELPSDRPFAILAESFSGPVALRLARLAPPGLVAVALAASFHRRPVGHALSALGRATAVAFASRLPVPAIRLLLAGSEAPADLVAEIQAATNALPGRVLAARTRAALEVDASEEVTACPVPLLFLVAERDRLLRAGLAGEVRSLNPRAEVRTLLTPHLLLQLRPREAMAVLEEFLQRALERVPDSHPAGGESEEATSGVSSRTPA